MTATPPADHRAAGPASAQPDAAALRARLAEAHLYLCTDARTAQGDLERFVASVLEAGVDIVQLRDRSLDTAEEVRLLRLLSPVAAQAGALLAVNDRADVARVVGADVLHTGQDDLSIADARAVVGTATLLGRSTHSVEQAAAAEADPGVDYFCVGPLWATPTKPGRAAVGLDTLRAVAATEPATPWFAIGGVDADRLPEVLDAGARRIVVVRALTEALDPAEAARALRRLL